MTLSPEALVEVKKWGHGLIIATANGLYDALSQGQAVGHVALKAVAMAVVIRFSGFVVSKVGP